jgi:DNA helicase-4
MSIQEETIDRQKTGGIEGNSQNEIKILQQWFTNCFPALYPPNDEQAAVILDRGSNTLVTARAGSGKTTMLIYKVLYLVEHEHVDPSGILLLAFNKNAAVLLRERLFKALVSESEYRYFIAYVRQNRLTAGHLRERALNEALSANRIVLPHIMTFHALAYRITRPGSDTFQINSDTNSLNQTAFQAAVAEQIENDDAYENYVTLFKQYLKDTESDGPEAYHTLNGIQVLSRQDREIGNLLFNTDLPCRYIAEKRVNEGYFVVLPDGQEHPLAVFCSGNKKFRPEHENFRAVIEISTSDFEDNGDITLESEKLLYEELKSNTDTDFKHLCSREKFAKAVYAREKIRNIFYSLIVICKQKKITPGDLESIIKVYSPKFSSEILMNRHLHSIYRSYEKILKEENLYDFPALFTAAEEKLKNGSVKNFFTSKLTYILVDEFQDFSRCYYDLLQEIRNSSDHEIRITAVGDDWQSINAYAGAMIDFFQDFGRYFKNGTRLDMLTNYRSVRKIIEASNAVMSNLGRGAVPHSMEDGIAATVIPSSVKFKIDTHEEIYEITNYLLKKRHSGETIAVLARTQAEVARYQDELKGCDVKIQTVHGFKGREADYVIADVSSWFFPLVHPDSIYSEIVGLSRDKIIDEERRLLYVAMTRARRELYLVAPCMKQSSPFLTSCLGSLTNMCGSRSPWKEGRICTAVTATISGKTYRIKEDIKKFGYRFDMARKNWYKKFPDKEIFFSEYKRYYFVSKDLKFELYNADEQKVTIESQGSHRS